MHRQLKWLRVLDFIYCWPNQSRHAEWRVYLPFWAFGENYHTDDLVGFAWSCGGKALCYRQAWSFFRNHFQGFLRKTSLKIYDFKKSKGSLCVVLVWICRLLPLIAAWLNTSLSTVEDNEIATIASLYGQTYLVDDETFYGKEVSKKPFLNARNSWNIWLVRLQFWSGNKAYFNWKTQRKWAVRASLWYGATSCLCPC